MNVIYNSFKKDVMSGAINLATDDIKIMLVTSAYAPNIDTHVNKTDVTNEIAGTGYTAGGISLAGKSVTQDNTDDEGVFSANNVSWAGATFAAAGAVLYKTTGGNLVCYFDFGGTQTVTSGTFAINWSAEGILNLN